MGGNDNDNEANVRNGLVCEELETPVARQTLRALRSIRIYDALRRRSS
jgi:hypothetical protein